MWVIFTKHSPYKKRAKFLAVAWTLLIFVLCFLPGNELPKVDLPLIDKWVHFILFAIFSFLWLVSAPSRSKIYLFTILVITVFVGWLVEYIQGHYAIGRFQDDMDTLADSVGGLIGIIIFFVLSLLSDDKVTLTQ